MIGNHIVLCACVCVCVFVVVKWQPEEEEEEGGFISARDGADAVKIVTVLWAEPGPALCAHPPN